jgi:hypothetical protein
VPPFEDDIEVEIDPGEWFPGWCLCGAPLGDDDLCIQRCDVDTIPAPPPDDCLDGS